MTDGLLRRVWRSIFNPPPPPCVRAAADAQAEAASKLVRRIENNSRRGLSLSLERDLSQERGVRPNGHAD